jgi:ankyrin repeat protein
LHEAANFGQAQALEVLLKARGDPNAADAFGNTPLHFSAYGGHAPIAKVLVGSRADLHRTNKDGETPLKIAEDSEKIEMVDILRAAGA